MGKVILVQIIVLLLTANSEKIRYKDFGAAENYGQMFNVKKEVQIEKLTIYVHVPRFMFDCGQVSCQSNVRLYELDSNELITGIPFTQEANLNWTEIRPFVTINIPQKIVLREGIKYVWVISKEPKLPLYLGILKQEPENVKINANMVNKLEDGELWTVLEENLGFDMQTKVLNKIDFSGDKGLSEDFWEKSKKYKWEDNKLYGERKINITRKARTVIPKHKNLYLGLFIAGIVLFLLVLLVIVYQIWKYYDMKKLNRLIEEEKAYLRKKRAKHGDSLAYRLKRRKMKMEKRARDLEKWKKLGAKVHYMDDPLLNKTFVCVIKKGRSVDNEKREVDLNNETKVF
ncbi:hypothetical protein MHBO_003405 [Bonamia ostreae]|uniref:Uncharacterized protein n=1 Tax=Bonamia ostreae TaxID=126728 RepID=A0ABV2AQD5_9EUKA